MTSSMGLGRGSINICNMLKHELGVVLLAVRHGSMESGQSPRKAPFRRNDVEAPRIISISEWACDREGARLGSLDQDVQDVLG